jgi:hypothetical protein
MRGTLVLTWLLFGLVLALPGCGGGNNIWVTGKLLKGGAVYVPPEGQNVYITLVAMETKDAAGKPMPPGDTYVANLDRKTGAFTVPGRDGWGVPPGKYRIAVTQKMSRETFDAVAAKAKKGTKGLDRETDTLGNKFGIETSPIVRELTGAQEIAVDLDSSS